MLKKYIVLLSMSAAIIFIFVAAAHYPGGEQFNKNSVGFSWSKNYLSNLFTPQAVNGLPNPARPWAIAGITCLCFGVAMFFYRFSKKISHKGAANIIKYSGIAGMVVGVFAVTRYHDIVITIAGTCALLSMFYITVFIFKSKLVWLKVFSVVCLLVFYGCNTIYYTGTRLDLLPIVQKVCLLTNISWMLCLEHFTSASDFESSRKKAPAAV